MSFSQEQKTHISGKIATESGTPIPGAFIELKGTTINTATDYKGRYNFSVKRNQAVKLKVTGMGYLDSTKPITLDQDSVEMDFVLVSDPEMTLDDVVLLKNSDLKNVQESSYNVVALDAEALHNTTLDISEALNKTSGVRVRRSGGVGSDYNVMLNGFTGQHVKVFMDGVPMEGMNSAFQLNNIPINMAKRIETYKGVVPISFGSDALGGAINIVSDHTKKNFLEASYSFGSFNTHKSFINGAYVSDSGFTARLTAFQNYSDNDYKVDAEIADLENHQFTGDVRRVRRFNDKYKNYTLMGKIGFVNKSFADELLLGVTLGDEYDQIQHPAYMKIAFGDKYTTTQTLMPSLTYKKKDLLLKNLDVSLSANYNFGRSENIDDSYRKYNWLGEYIETDAPGEFNYSKNHMKEGNGSINANISYDIEEQHTITLNNSLNTFNRENKDYAEPKPTDNHPDKTLKNVVGLGYKYQPNERLSTSVFTKYYVNNAKHYDEKDSGEFGQMSASTGDLGYGLAASYFLLEDLQLKTSFEKALRIPTGRELFGSKNDFELGNTDLKSETSNNFNFGLNYTWLVAQDHVLNIDGSFIYRAIKDFIRQVPDPSDGVLKPGNEAKVRNKGIDLGLQYSYDQLFSVETNLTYQNLRNKLKYRSGKEVVSTIYNDRIPNKPYLYGNAGATVFFQDVFSNQDDLNFSYGVQYIHKFDYSYESYNGQKIPSQISHDLSLNYSFNDGRYNLSFEAQNIFDKNLYDNFSLQKPGRSFFIKLRYFLDKF